MSELMVAILGSSVVSTLLSAIISRINKHDDLRDGLCALLGFQIRTTCEKIIKEKKTTISEFRQLQELNVIYHKLGGNGYVKALMEKVSKAEIVED